MVLIHMVVAATAFLMSFPPALIQELSKHSGAAPGTHAAIPLFQITIGSVTNWLGSVAGYVFFSVRRHSSHVQCRKNFTANVVDRCFCSPLPHTNIND